jgi:flagellar biosynthesis protein FliR
MDFSVLAGFGLLLVRVGTLVAATPILGGTFAPRHVKVGLIVLIAIVLVPVVPLPAQVSGGALPIYALRECVIGLALALAIRVVTGAAELGGYLIGFQLGFGYAGIVDPQTGARNNVLATMYASLTAITLLAVNAHHAVLRALAQSYTVVPLGPFAGVDDSIVRTVGGLLGVVFHAGVQLAAPVVLALLVVELLLGIITRAAPALSIMVVGAPVRLLVGLVALAAAIGVVPGVTSGLVGKALELGARLAMAFR